MPTVLLIDGFRFEVFPRDHPPAHVHVSKAGRDARLALGDLAVLGAATLRPADVRRAQAILSEHLTEVWEAWRRYHG